MEISWITYIIICPLVFLGGFVDSIAGGGGLVTLPAYVAVGLSSHSAMATNKLANMIGTCVATINYIRQGYVRLAEGVFASILAILGAFLGSKTALFLDDFTLRIILIILLPLSAIFVLSSKGMSKERAPYSRKKTFVIICIVALLLGFYDGFYGPGTGTLIIFLLTSIGHMKITESNGIAKVINLSSNITSMILFLVNGKTFIILGLVAGIFNAVGNFIGSKLFIKNGIKIVKPVMIFVMILLFAKIVIDMFIAPAN